MEERTIINIGRQFGSGGRSVARAIGEKLGIDVYDQELLTKAAEESGFSRSLFEKKDEKMRSFGLAEMFRRDTELFKMQSDTIRNIASKGSAIFIGRASDYVLRDMDCLDVFICAPQDERVRFVMEREGITADEAAEMIRRMDKSRSGFYNVVTFGQWGVAANYDLCVDSSILGIEGTADFIIDFGRKAGLIHK